MLLRDCQAKPRSRVGEWTEAHQGHAIRRSFVRDPMHWTSDHTGLFVKRPYYSTGELDHLSEQLITTFLAFRHPHVAFPVATDDLTVLVQYLGATLDASADLSAHEGM